MTFSETWLLLFFIVVLLQLYFLVAVFGRFVMHPVNEEDPGLLLEVPVSVIVCAHNEMHHLPRLVDAIDKQHHSNFELIFVNDRSTDGSAAYLAQLQATDPTKKVVTITHTPYRVSPKKYALTKGIESASHSVLLLTDADCLPVSPFWIRTMTSLLQPPSNEQTEVCLGYSPFYKQKGLLNKIIRFETFYTAIQYFSFAMSGYPYMGVGRNLAYRKELFFKTGGFAKHETIISGDDDLFGNEAFHSQNVVYTFSKDSHTVSMAKQTYGEYFLQKTRHLSAGLYYRPGIRRLLGLLVGSQLGFYLLLLPIVLTGNAGIITALAALTRTVILIFVMSAINKKLHENFAWYWFPALEFIYLINYILTGVNAIFSKKIKWM